MIGKSVMLLGVKGRVPYLLKPACLKGIVIAERSMRELWGVWAQSPGTLSTEEPPPTTDLEGLGAFYLYLINQQVSFICSQISKAAMK